MDEYPSNSNKDRSSPGNRPSNERPHQQPVVSGEVLRRKKPWSKKVADHLARVNLRNVAAGVFMGVLAPAAKDMLFDAVRESASRTIYGDGPTRGGNYYRGGGGRDNHTNYTRMYSGGSSSSSSSYERRDDPDYRRHRANHKFDEIILPSRVEADEVLNKLFNLIRESGVATVADFYELVGEHADFTDERYGWDNLNGARVSRLRTDQYLLEMPPTIALT